MDLKITCTCGQKIAFEVEPVQGGMPQPVSCPACGADATELANLQIRQIQATPAPATAPAPRVRIAAPVPTPAVALSTESTEDLSPPPPSAVSSGPPRPRHTTAGVLPVPETQESWLSWAKSTAWIVVACLVGFYACVAKVRRQVRLADTLIEGSHESTKVPLVQWTLPDDDGTMLLIKGTNDAAVAQLAATYWQNQQHRPVSISRIPPGHAPFENVNFVVHSPAAGAIEVDGPLTVEANQAAALTGLAQHLSQNLHTLTVSAIMGDDAEVGVLTIFENGQKVFSCDRKVRFTKDDLIEDVKLEGQQWAAAKGYQPREGNWKTFTMYDADGLVQHLGFKPLPFSDQETVTVLR